VRPTTLHSYRTNLERYVLPRIGQVPLQRLTPAHLNGLYTALQAAGGRDGGPLSARTVQAVHMTVRKALGDAARWGLVARNVAQLADPPSPKRVDMRTWTASQLRAFLEHVESERLAALWMLAASTGMRRGEVLGVRWVDVDLDLAGSPSGRRSCSPAEKSSPASPRRAAGVARSPWTRAPSPRCAWKAAQAAERLAWGPSRLKKGLGCWADAG
jgi:integrase